MRIPIVDYYAVLGVHPGAEDVVIRAAYKALAQRYHPDRFPGSKDEAHRRMSQISKAYEVLADPVRRPKYDRRRQFAEARSTTVGFNDPPRYALPALPTSESPKATGKRSRAAVATVMVVVGVLSALNLFHYSPLLKEWLGVSTATTPTLPITQSRGIVAETAIPDAEPLPPVSAAPAPEDVAAMAAVKETARSGTKPASINRPARSAPAAVEAAKAKAEAAPAKTCSQQQLLLGLCN
jgi:hypothetical protein